MQVVRVWFCNRRQKEKRMLSGALNAAGGLMLSDPGSAASSDLHEDCSPASESISGDDLPAAAADSCNGPSTAVAPPLFNVDYCNALQSTRPNYCAVDDSAFQSGSAHAQPAPPEAGLSSYACAGSGWTSHFRSPQFASLMVAAAAGAMLPPDTHTVSSLAM